MTPERLKEIQKLFQNGGNDFLEQIDEIVPELLDSALRLAAIEAAGDEEVELMLKTIGGDASDSEKTNAFLWLRWIFKSRNATIADLRAKLGEATERIQDLEDGIEAARLGL